MFESLAVPYLARQPWTLGDTAHYGRTVWAGTKLVDCEIVFDGRPGLASVVIAVDGRLFHILVGWRDPTLAPAVLKDEPGAVLGVCDDGAGEVLCYNAMADEELAAKLLERVSSGTETAQRVRLVQSLLSHASIVYDDRLFMKAYRVLERAPRPEVDLVRRLDAVGFMHMSKPVAYWERNGWDLALVREYIPGSVEGRLLALTSLRDLLGRNVNEPHASLEEVARAGGDLSSEMRRLGEITADFHLALAEAFGVRRTSGADVASKAWIRVHGDYHLRRVFRTDEGWLVTGFGDDPLIGRPAEAIEPGAARFASPLEDLADLSYSLRSVAAEAVAAQPVATWGPAGRLAKSWERRNRGAFLSGYLGASGIGELVNLDRRVAMEALKPLIDERVAIDR
jgi:predicted trehalose synthase